jgi:signal transduction histidine kinase
MISPPLHVIPDVQTPSSAISWPSCRLGETPPSERLKQRIGGLTQLGLTHADSIPAFDEATQVAARFLKADVCTLSIADATTEFLKAAYGLSHLGLGNPLSQTRQLPLREGLSQYVLDSEQPLVLEDTTQNSVVATSQLVKTYNLSAYVGVPVKTSQQQCVGVLAVMFFAPRQFTAQDIAFLEITARWCISEYERQAGAPSAASQTTVPQASKGLESFIHAVRLNLIGQLTQDLRNPLTAVMGMASMLSREIYGPLTAKQREYMDVVLSSSQKMMNRVDEIVDLGIFDAETTRLAPSQVDITMLSQQVLNTLEPMASKREQTFKLTVEPGERLWVIDQKTVKQILYHLIFSVMQMAGNNSTIRLHACRKDNFLTLAVWLSNPWLGDGLPQIAVQLCHRTTLSQDSAKTGLVSSHPGQAGVQPPNTEPLKPQEISRDLLGFLLSRQLAERHGGHLQLQGNAEAGYRCVVSLVSLEQMVHSMATETASGAMAVTLNAAE